LIGVGVAASSGAARRGGGVYMFNLLVIDQVHIQFRGSDSEIHIFD